jgi:hypothetical protein
VLYTLPTTSEEDDLAGVSALMKALPDKDPKPAKRKRAAKKPATKPKTTAKRSKS